jgi:hypothetical protein
MAMMAIWTPLCAAALALLYVLVDKISSTQAEAKEMALVLRRVNLQLLEELLNPATEAALRSELSSRAFRCRQRTRIMAAREQVSRMRHNAEICREWGTDEYRRFADKNRGHYGDEEQLVIALIKAADDVTTSARRALLKLMFWRMCLIHVWPFLPSPSLSDVREVLGADLLARYEALANSAGMLLLNEGEEQYELVRAAL